MAWTYALGTDSDKEMIMFERSRVLVLLVVCLSMAPMAAWAGSAGTTVTITGTVDPFAEWDSATQTIAPADFSGHITAVNQTRTATKTFKLYMNADVSIAPSTDAAKKDGILTDIATGTQFLTTQYRLTGDLDTPDVAYKVAGTGAGEFFAAANTYDITHDAGDGTYDVTLSVQMISAAAAAPDAGDYSCGLVLTATW
jgi:hypothetical protein